jgi:hypothetical protein
MIESNGHADRLQEGPNLAGRAGTRRCRTLPVTLLDGSVFFFAASNRLEAQRSRRNHRLREGPRPSLTASCRIAQGGPRASAGLRGTLGLGTIRP